ncbi:MAG TPA: Spi family protease inhibitor, partial [Paludibacter sp.]
MKTRINRALLLFSFIVLIASNGSAKSRTSLEAFTIANSFSQKTQNSMTRSKSVTSADIKLAYTRRDSVTTRSSNASAYYYIFNIGENNGFVIVSGDDRAKNILGYADSG